MRNTSPAVTLAALLLASTASMAAPGDQIGSALVVVNQVTAELSRETRTLQTGDRVRQEEIIQAASDGSTELKLDDETKLAIGPGAKLKLDRFVYAPAASGNQIVLDLAKGAFRFITGVAAKPAYVIKTPSAAITVRGTIFDVFVENAVSVENSRASWLLLHDGGVKICNSRGVCRIHTSPGRFVRIAEDGTISQPACWSDMSAKERLSLEQMFPFVVAPPSIDAKPIFTRASLASASLCERPTRLRKAEKSLSPPIKQAKKIEKPKKLASPKRVWKPSVKIVIIGRPPRKHWDDDPRRGGITIPPINRRIHIPSRNYGQFGGNGKSGLGLKGLSFRNRLR